MGGGRRCQLLYTGKKNRIDFASWITNWISFLPTASRWSMAHSDTIGGMEGGGEYFLSWEHLLDNLCVDVRDRDRGCTEPPSCHGVQFWGQN